MKISVVLPVYNSKNTLERAVSSILNQSFTDYELIIVNDGSTDGTADLLHQLIMRDSRLICFHLKRAGIARALNFAIKMSSGKYIARMDADDFSHPDRLRFQYQYLEAHPEVGLVSGKVNFKGDVDKNEGYALFVDWINGIISHQDILAKRFQETPIAHPSVCFRSRLIRQFGGYNEGDLPEDYELWLRWLNHGVVMAKTERFIIDWYDHPERSSRVYRQYRVENFYKVKARYLAKYLYAKFQDKLPELWVWGAGRTINKKIKPLAGYGLRVARHIDVKKRDRTSKKFIHYQNLPPPGTVFVLSYVSDREGKQKILTFLKNSGYREGTDFLMMA